MTLDLYLEDTDLR